MCWERGFERVCLEWHTPALLAVDRQKRIPSRIYALVADSASPPHLGWLPSHAELPALQNATGISHLSARDPTLWDFYFAYALLHLR